MSIPLVQNNEKDSINTSLIAIKRQIERINMLLGLSNSEEIDTSKFATKEELQQAVTDLQPVDEVALNNMHSVTSNAVAGSLSYSTTEQKTGGTWIDGKPIYRKSFSASGISSEVIILSTELNKTTITPIKAYGFGENSANGDLLCVGYGNGANVLVNSSYLRFGGDYVFSAYNITIEYTKTTD